MNTYQKIMSCTLGVILAINTSYAAQLKENSTKVFPGVIPDEKPTDIPLSAATQRLYDVWNPHEDRGNELYSNFKYSQLEGLAYTGSMSRRDPSKVIKIDGTYYVWYTKRATENFPVWRQGTETNPSADWDLADIWYATSQDGFSWEEKGIAVARPEKPGHGWRSVATPDILIWKGKYYLYYQAFNAAPGNGNGDRAAATVAWSDSVTGPWTAVGHDVVPFGKSNEWDENAIHDPYPLVYKGKIHLYYKGSPGQGGRNGTLIRAQGVAISDNPLGPFTKSPFNPVINSGHETGLFPYKGGIAAIVSLDGPEKNTVQYAEDGINFHPVSMLMIPPVAPGPFVADAFLGDGNGRGITWGLMHLDATDAQGNPYKKLGRFDCDLSLDVDIPILKKNNLRFNEETYFQPKVVLPRKMKREILQKQSKQDKNMILPK